MRGEDHHAKVLIDIEDSVSGATRFISLRMPDLADDGHITIRERTLSVRIPKGGRPLRPADLPRGPRRPGDRWGRVG